MLKPKPLLCQIRHTSNTTSIEKDIYGYISSVAKIILKKVLEQKKLSKRAFALKLGIDVGNVFRFFRPNYDPRFSMLERWAKALNMKVRDLLEE